MMVRVGVSIFLQRLVQVSRAVFARRLPRGGETIQIQQAAVEVLYIKLCSVLL